MAMSLRHNVAALIDRLTRRFSRLAPESDEMKATFAKIGQVVAAETVANIRSQRLIDTGRLMNSIRWEYLREGKSRVGIRVGSFGVPYAAVHEFGFSGTVAIRGHSRLVTHAYGRRVANPAKHPVRPHVRRMFIPKRPYLRPAVKKHREFIVESIAKMFGRG